MANIPNNMKGVTIHEYNEVPVSRRTFVREM